MSIVVSVECVWESHTPSPCHTSRHTYHTSRVTHQDALRPLVDKPTLVRADSAEPHRFQTSSYRYDATKSDSDREHILK